MKATSLAVAAMAMACSVVTASVPADNSSKSANKTQQPTVQSSSEYQAAEDQFRKYQEAYDRGDAKTLASFYAEDVDYIDQDGVEVKGRGEMEKLFMENFQANPGAKIAITIEEVKPLTPDVGPSGVTERNPELRIRFRYSRQSKFWGGFDPLPRWMIFLLCSAARVSRFRPWQKL
jgi:hypothetical protein